MSETNRTSVLLVPETTAGVTPTNGTWETVRFTGSSLEITTNTTESQEIRSDRQIADLPKVSSTVGGSFDFEFSPTSFDTLLEAAMKGTWTSDVVKTGTEDRTFSIQQSYLDVGATGKHVILRGMTAASVELNFSYGEILTGSFSFAGTGYDRSDTSYVGSGTVTPATTTSVWNATSDIGVISIGGSPALACFQSLSLSLDNGVRENTCIGYEVARKQKTGTSRVTGSISAYLDEESWGLYEQMLDNTSVSLEMNLDDGTNTYTFTLPAVKLSGSLPPIDSLDSDVMLDLDFTAIYDPVSGTNFQITRS